MNKSFRSGASVHTLINDAPLSLLPELIAASCPELERPVIELADESVARHRLLDVTNALSKEGSRRLDDVAGRIIGLGRGRGSDVLHRVVAPRLLAAEASTFSEQLDELGRSIWAYLHQPNLFEDAESLQHAVHFRDYLPIFAAFDAPACKDFAWTEELAGELERSIAELDLEGPVRLSHLTIEEQGIDGQSHVIIVRHGGDLTSVAEHRRDGAKKRHYYNPSNEVTLIYAPSRGVVEVCADSPSVRQDIAVCFAEVGLEQDLSAKPLSFKLYNLARFRESLSLPFFEPEGFRLKAAKVVEVETRPRHPSHRLSLKVTADDEIEDVAEGLFGVKNPFRRASITRVVIAVQYWPNTVRAKPRTLNITLSHPNRCNLRSQRNPELRRLGYDLLEHWEILQALRTPTPQDERRLLPMLLEVYDLGLATMTERDLRERRIDVDALSGHGFIEPAGRFDAVVIEDDDGRPDLVEIRPGLGDMVEFDDARGRPAWMLSASVTKYKINHDWVEQVVHRQLRPGLANRAIGRPVDGLTLLGELDLGEERVPCYLARGLSGIKTLRRLDSYLRGQAKAGIGLILNAGCDAPDCLGANVVLSMSDFLSTDDDEPAFDLQALRTVFAQSKSRARGGMTVEFAPSESGDTGMLYVPGKEPLLAAGADQIRIVERLVKAHHDGSLAVRTGQLMEGTGSQAPSQAFPNWKGTVDRYIVNSRRGFWQLGV